MKRLLLICVGLLSLGAAIQKEVSAEDAIDTAKRFIKENGIQGKFQLSSCYRLKYAGKPGGFVWHMYMTRDGSQEYSIGITSEGKLIWLEPSGGGEQKIPKVDAQWQKKALQKANDIQKRLQSPWTIAPPSEDLVRFAQNSVFFPIALNGKRFVGENLGYNYEFREDLELTRFLRNDDVPPVNTSQPTVKPEVALAEVKESLEADAKQMNSLREHRFELGKAQLVYYYRRPDMKEARLCWYFKVKAEYTFDFSARMGWFGIVVDALTGKRIKTPTMLS